MGECFANPLTDSFEQEPVACLTVHQHNNVTGAVNRRDFPIRAKARLPVLRWHRRGGRNRIWSPPAKRGDVNVIVIVDVTEEGHPLLVVQVKGVARSANPRFDRNSTNSRKVSLRKSLREAHSVAARGSSNPIPETVEAAPVGHVDVEAENRHRSTPPTAICRCHLPHRKPARP